MNSKWGQPTGTKVNNIVFQSKPIIVGDNASIEDHTTTNRNVVQDSLGLDDPVMIYAKWLIMKESKEPKMKNVCVPLGQCLVEDMTSTTKTKQGKGG